MTVYDLDDADYLEHNQETIQFFARNCNFISAGSLEIAKYIRQYNQNILHITSPTPDLGLMKQERNKTFTIGWLGGFGWGHRESLRMNVFPAIKNLSFACKFILIGVNRKQDEHGIREYFKDAHHVTIEIPGNIDWNDEKALQARISQFDVGVATLLNYPIQIAKSGIKAKQYMNNGIPVLCNDLPENSNIVIDGYNGYICGSVKEFGKRLTEFNEMPDDRYWEFSANAKQSTENFNHYHYFENFRKIISSEQFHTRFGT